MAAPWEEAAQAASAPDVPPWEAARPTMLERAAEPITSLPSTYKRRVGEATTQMSTGAGQFMSGVRSAVTPSTGTETPAERGAGPVNVIKGLLNMVMGGIGYTTAPISAPVETVVAKPVENVTGIPKEYTQFATELAIPGVGFTRLKGPKVPEKVTPPREAEMPPAAEPVPSSEVVRFYHGGFEPGAGGARWVTTDPEYARNFRASGRPNQVHYVDIPKGDPAEIAMRSWDDIDVRGGTNMVGRYHHAEIPEEWAKRMRPLEETPIAATPEAPPPWQEARAVAPERVDLAAVSYNGKVYTGNIHSDAIEKLIQDTGMNEARFTKIYNDIIQGYVTDKGRFIDRAEAMNRTGAKNSRMGGSTYLVVEKPTLDAPTTRTEPPPQSLSGAAPGAPPPGNAPLPPAPAAAEQAVLARIGTQPKAPWYNATDAYTDLVDNLHPIRKLVDEAAAGKPIDTILNPYEQFRLARGVGGKADHFLHHGTFDPVTFKNVGPSFAEIIKPVEKELDSFKAYLMSKRALELEPRGIESGIPLDAARVTVANGARFEPQAQALQRYQSEMLDYVKKLGLLSDDAVAAMRAASDDYLPFYRVMDDPRMGGTGGRGFTTRTPTSRLEGSERLIVDPLESVIRNTHTFITLAERNRALNTFVDFATANPNVVKLQKVGQVRPVTVHADEVGRVLEDMGVPTQMYGPAESFDIFRRMDKQLAPDEIAVWHEGKRTVYRTDPEIASIIKGMDQESLRTWEKVLGAPARLLRAGVVLSPEYMLRNITRDQMNAFIQSKHGYKPVYDLLKGLWQVGTGGKAYQNWLKGGGSQSALVAIDRDYVGSDVWRYGPNPTAMQNVKNFVRTPLDWLRAVSESLDNATRVGEFMRATKGADDPAAIMQGSMAARNVTQDFQRIGAKTRGMNSITAFMNAQIQGMDRELSTLRRNPASALPKIAAMITLPSVYLWAANHGDPRYENAPNWEKDQFWFILPSDPNKEAFKVPKPFTFGMAFGSLPERILSDYFNGKPEAYNEFLKNITGTMTPNVVPTFAVPMIEQFANRSIFLDRPLVPDRLKRGVVTEQYTAQTPEVAKLVGLGVSKIPGMSESALASPINIENYVRQWTGTLGRYGMAAADKFIPSDKPPAPAATIADMPVIRAFVSRYPSASAQPIQDFYKAHGELERLATSARNLQREGQSERGELMRAQIYERTKGPARQLSALNREIRTIQASRTMSPEDKREKIRSAYLEMIKIAEQGNRIIRDAKLRIRQRGYQGPD